MPVPNCGNPGAQCLTAFSAERSEWKVKAFALTREPILHLSCCCLQQPMPYRNVAEADVRWISRVTRDGAPVHLTPNEFKLLAVLVKHAGMVLTHRQLLKDVWGPGAGDELHYVRVFSQSEL